MSTHTTTVKSGTKRFYEKSTTLRSKISKMSSSVNEKILFKKISANAYAPAKGSPEAAGWDLKR